MPDVLLVRALGGDDRDAEVLRSRGVRVVEDPYLVVTTCTDDEALTRAQTTLGEISERSDWLAVTSRAALRALSDLVGKDALAAAVAAGTRRGLACAAVGPSTAHELRELGAADVLVPATPTAAGLLALLSERSPGRLVTPQGSQAMTSWTRGLRTAGWQVDEKVVYVTATVPHRPPTADAVARGDFAAVLFRSPTAVRAAMSFVDAIPEPTIAVCGGPTTADEATRSGLTRVAISPGPTAESVAESVVLALSRLPGEPGTRAVRGD